MDIVNLGLSSNDSKFNNSEEPQKVTKIYDGITNPTFRSVEIVLNTNDHFNNNIDTNNDEIDDEQTKHNLFEG